MFMRLTADHLEILAGERVRGALGVASILVSPEDARAELEDVGFAEVLVHRELPDGWRIASIPALAFPEWLGWFEGTASIDASYKRQLSDRLRIVRAWDAQDDAPAAPPRAPTSSALGAWALVLLAVGGLGFVVFRRSR
jgi:hypothetical protein